MPVYKIDVKDKVGPEGKIIATHAVEAKSEAGALNHVRDVLLSASRITATEAFALRDSGVQLEVAGVTGAAPQTQLPGV